MGLIAAWQMLGLTQPPYRTYRGLSIFDESSLGRAQNEVLRVMLRRSSIDNLERKYRWGACIGFNTILIMSFLEYPFMVQSIRRQLQPRKCSVSLSPYHEWLELGSRIHLQGWFSIYQGFWKRRIYDLVYLAAHIGLDYYVGRQWESKDYREKSSGSFWTRRVLKRFLMKTLIVSITLPLYRDWILSLCISEQQTTQNYPSHGWMITLRNSIQRRFTSSLGLPLRTLYGFLFLKLTYDLIEENLGRWIEDHITESLRSSMELEETMNYTFSPRMMGYVGSMTLVHLLLYPISTLIHRFIAQTYYRRINDDTIDYSSSSFHLTLWNQIKLDYRKEGWLMFYNGFGSFLLQTLIQTLLMEFSVWTFKRLSRSSRKRP